MTVKTLRVLSLSFFCTSILLVPDPRQLEARGRRMRCVPMCVCAASSNAALSYDTHICPQYVFMIYGDYCSYYALGYPSCNPMIYDSTLCDLYAPGCSSSANCEPMPLASRHNHPGELGYGHPNKPMESKVDDGQLPGADLQNLAVQALGFKTIKFRTPVPADEVVYAQIFIARVIPRKQPVNPPSHQSLVASRGLQIQPPTSPVDYDLTVPRSGNPTIAPIAGSPYAYKLTFPDASLGVREVGVVLHHSARPHNH